MAKGSGVIGLIGPAVLAGGIALGVSYADPFGGRNADGAEAAAPGEAENTKAKDKAKKGKDKKAKDEKGGAGGPAVLAPLVVSLAQAEGLDAAPHLRVSLAIQSESGAEVTEADRLGLRDAFTAAIRRQGTAALLAPDGLEVLRAALNDTARTVLGDEAARVLITDYVLI